jgi:cell division transport system ATP-binding protein
MLTTGLHQPEQSGRMIEFVNVSKYHNPGWPSLDNICLRIEKGEFVLLTGKSGSGKTTLLNHMYMKEKPTSGNVYVDTFDSSSIKRTDIPLLRRKIGMIFQEPHLLFDRNVFENIALPLRLAGLTELDTRKKVFSSLSYVGLSHRMNDKPLRLSMGEKQRICIARSLVCDPLVLLADEPVGNLDSETAADILKLLRNIHVQGTAVIIATHMPSIADDLPCRRIHIESGKLVSDRRRS